MAKVANTHNIVEDGKYKSLALPNGAATTNSDGIQIHDGDAQFLIPHEVEIIAPALATSPLPDTKTMKYSLQQSSDDGVADAYATIPGCENIITQTGAGGAGAAAQTERVRLPADVEKYIRLSAVNSGAGDASGSSATVSFMV